MQTKNGRPVLAGLTWLSRLGLPRDARDMMGSGQNDAGCKQSIPRTLDYVICSRLLAPHSVLRNGLRWSFADALRLKLERDIV